MPAWPLDISSGYGTSLYIFLCGCGARQGGSATKELHCASLIPCTHHSQPSPGHCTRILSMGSKSHLAPGSLSQPKLAPTKGSSSAEGWRGKSFWGGLEHPTARKSPHLAEQGLGITQPMWNISSCPDGLYVILKVASGPGLERAPTNPPQASVIPSRKQLLPPIFPGA